MSGESLTRLKVSKISVGRNIELEVLTLANSSQINIEKLTNGALPGTFWIDLRFGIESELNVRVKSMEMVPMDLRIPDRKDCILVAHEPDDDLRYSRQAAARARFR